MPTPMPTLRDITSLTLDVYFGGYHSPACVVRRFDATEWCRVRPENRRQHLRNYVEQIFEEMIHFIEPITEQETQDDFATARQALEQAAFGPFQSLRSLDFPDLPEVRSVGVDRPRRRGENTAVR